MIFTNGVTQVIKQASVIVEPTSPYQPPVKSEYLPPPIREFSSRFSFVNLAFTKYKMIDVLTNITIHILLKADCLSWVKV